MIMNGILARECSGLMAYLSADGFSRCLGWPACRPGRSDTAPFWYVSCLHKRVVRCPRSTLRHLMEADLKLAFDIPALTSVMVLIVLGLGVIASMMGVCGPIPT
jgi:hypothetical protein